MQIGVTYDAKLIDPRLVRVLVRLKIRTEGLSQAVIDAAGLGRCDVSVTVELARKGWLSFHRMEPMMKLTTAFLALSLSALRYWPMR